MGEIFERQRPTEPLEWTGERLTTAVDGQVEIEHLHRYFLARELVRGLDVLDVASGEGYGTALLAQTAKSAVGVELSGAAARHAATAYRLPNLRFHQGDARALPLGDDSVDVVVSFETIEHFYEQEAFLAEVKRVLRSTGKLIVSSPDRDTYSPLNSEANPYHARELSRAEFTTLLQSTFGHVRMLSQRPMIGSVLLADTGQSGDRLTFERRGGNHYEASLGISRPVYLIALASDSELVDVPESIYVETSEVGPVLSRSGQYGDLVTLVGEAKAHVVGLQAEVDRLGRDAEGYRSQAEAAQGRLREAEARDTVDVLAVEHERIVAEFRDEVTELRSMLAEERQAVQFACSQRDMARLSLRRVSASANYAWRRQCAKLERDAAEAAADAAYWNARYHGLRSRLEAILLRFWILRFAKLFPRSLRRWVRERVLGAGR